MHMNLHLLRLFVAVAQTGSFSRAAESLWISQPAVSKGIRELENQLDLSLFERGVGSDGATGGKGIRTTEAGEALLAHARGIFALERAAMDDVRARVGVKRGSLTIGASTTVASYWLPPLIAEFCAAYPDVVPKVLVGNTQWVCEQLLECRIDLALVEGAVDDERIEVTAWQDDLLTLVIAAHAGQPKSGVDAAWLSQQNWILREPGSGTRQATEVLCSAHGVVAKPWMEMASNEAIARTVASGLGISMLPKVVVADLLQLGVLRELSFHTPAPLSRPLYRLGLSRRVLSPAAGKMVELLEQPKRKKPQADTPAKRPAKKSLSVARHGL